MFAHISPYVRFSTVRSVSINNLGTVNMKWSVSVISEMLQAVHSLHAAVDNMTHLQADIDISVLNELSGTKMDP